MDKDHVVMRQDVMEKLPTMGTCQISIANGDIWMETVLGVVDGQVVKTHFAETLAKHGCSGTNLNYEGVPVSCWCRFSGTWQ